MERKTKGYSSFKMKRSPLNKKTKIGAEMTAKLKEVGEDNFAKVNAALVSQGKEPMTREEYNKGTERTSKTSI